METEVKSCIQLIKSHFQLDNDDLVTENTFLDLESSLTSIIRVLLDHDLNRLLNAFYKIDIDEGKFKDILTLSPPNEIANSLAKEVIRREMKKVNTRNQYKNH